MGLYHVIFVSATLILTATAWSSYGSPPQVPFVVSETRVPTQPGAKSDRKSAITPEISALAGRLLQEHRVPGLSVGVVRMEGNSVVTQFGTWGNRSEDGAPVRADTLFSIGSCSKAFLASAIGILIDDFAHGRNVTALPSPLSAFTWDTKLQDLLPGDWNLEDQWATEKANIRDILTHVSGLTRHDFSYRRNDTPLDLHLKPAYELRQRWSYNNQMFILGAQIVSTYSGQRIQEFDKERIFEPLNMTSSTYSGAEAEGSGLLSQSWSDGGRRIPYWFGDNPSSELIAGAGGVISNVVDMTNWIATLLHRGVNPYTNRIVIPPSTFEEVTTAHSVVSGVPSNPHLSITGYGLGWMRLSYQGHNVIHHGGALPGFLSEVAFLPSDGVGVVAFVNGDGPHGVQLKIPIRIVEDFLGLDHQDPLVLGESSHAEDSPKFRSYKARTTNDVRCNTSANVGTPAVPLAIFAGTYFDPGYGSLTFCAPTSDSPSCARVLADFRTLGLNGTLDPNTLYASTDSVWATHLRMQRGCATGRGSAGYESFEFSAGTIFPHGYGRNMTPSPFAQGYFDSLKIEARCVVSEETAEVVGCGIMDLEEGRNASMTTGTVQQAADVWFKKVD